MPYELLRKDEADQPPYSPPRFSHLLYRLGDHLVPPPRPDNLDLATLPAYSAQLQRHYRRHFVTFDRDVDALWYPAHTQGSWGDQPLSNVALTVTEDGLQTEVFPHPNPQYLPIEPDLLLTDQAVATGIWQDHDYAAEQITFPSLIYPAVPTPETDFALAQLLQIYPAVTTGYPGPTITTRGSCAYNLDMSMISFEPAVSQEVNALYLLQLLNTLNREWPNMGMLEFVNRRYGDGMTNAWRNLQHYLAPDPNKDTLLVEMAGNIIHDQRGRRDFSLTIPQVIEVVKDLINSHLLDLLHDLTQTTDAYLDVLAPFLANTPYQDLARLVMSSWHLAAIQAMPLLPRNYKILPR